MSHTAVNLTKTSAAWWFQSIFGLFRKAKPSTRMSVNICDYCLSPIFLFSSSTDISRHYLCYGESRIELLQCFLCIAWWDITSVHACVYERGRELCLQAHVCVCVCVCVCGCVWMCMHECARERMYMCCVCLCACSPWYNCTGWLGIKHQVTYLLCTCQ